MKYIYHVVIIFLFSTLTHAQISMQSNLPLVAGVNSEITFEVKINKGSANNFSKYQLDVPEGLVVKELDSKNGTFSFEDNRAKIIWVISPPDAEFSITMKLLTGDSTGLKSLAQKYYYMENDDKKEVEMETMSIQITDSASGSIEVSTSPFVSLKSVLPKSLLTTTVSPSEINTQNPEVIKQQVIQLKKDSKDAKEVGEREKAKAVLKLKEANTAITKAGLLTNEEEKKTALDKANIEKEQAEKDLEIAGKVLNLAKNLNENANEIERINRSVNPGSYGFPAPSNANAINSTESPEKTDLTKGTDSSKDLAKLKEAFKTTDSQGEGKESKETHAIKVNENGLVFKIQVGAFNNEPDRSEFKALGKVTIVSDNGLFKVLFGSFLSREDAVAKRQEILTKGFDGFVVSYQDGVRLK